MCYHTVNLVALGLKHPPPKKMPKIGSEPTQLVSVEYCYHALDVLGYNLLWQRTTLSQHPSLAAEPWKNTEL